MSHRTYCPGFVAKSEQSQASDRCRFPGGFWVSQSAGTGCYRAARRSRAGMISPVRKAAALLLVLLVLAACGHEPPAPQSATSKAPTSTALAIPSRVRACVASELSTSGTWQGATGSLLGDVGFTNTGKEPCYLVGYLRISLVDERGQALAVQLRKGPPAAKLNPQATPMPVELSPGEPRTALVMLQWFNWCGASPGSVSVLVALTSGAHLRPAAMGTGGSRCDDSTAPSFLTEGPVQIPPS